MGQTFLDQAGLPLGLRNNNPGNLRPLSNGQKWQGEIAPDLVHGFSRFQDVSWGLRAMITDITGDIVLDGKNTIRKLVTAYAPPSENNTAAYIAAVASYTGMNPDAEITVNRATIEKIIKGKLNVELGASFASRLSAGDFTEAFDSLGSQVQAWLQYTAATGGNLGLILLAAALIFLSKK